MSDRVFIAGTSMSRFAKQPDVSMKVFAANQIADVLGQSGVGPARVDAVFVSNCLSGPVVGQHMVLGQTLLQGSGISSIPVFNIENACASGASALNLGWSAIASGQHEIVLVLGIEKMTHTTPGYGLQLLRGAMDVDESDELELTRVGTHGSVFMELYAEKARRYAGLTGATAVDLALVVVKNNANGMLNPLAQYGSSLSVDEVLASRMVCDPLTTLMCSPISDGAAAVVLCSEGVAREIGRRDVEVVASAVASSGFGSSPHAVESAAQAAYAQASLGPADIQHIELHDATASAELELYESLGLAPAGGGPELIRSGATAIRGWIPVNTSGGLLSRGHPIGATALAQVHEGVLQLRNQAGDRQVEGVRVSLCQSVGGWVGHDNAAAAVTILSAAH